MGGDVMLVGPLPTPGISFITASMRADAGVVISASHNDYDDNGIKLFDGRGLKLSVEQERSIEDAFEDALRPAPCAGTIRELEAAAAHSWVCQPPRHR